MELTISNNPIKWICKTKLMVETRIIVITGAESTGKTQLARQLSERLDCEWIPELSRNFIEKLSGTYTYTDVEEIARQQIQQVNDCINSSSRLVIFDTGLIITKVWFDVVYNKHPQWLVDTITKMPKVLHLLCDTDIEWVADSVRENGGDMRDKLTGIYKKELDEFGFPYQIVSGMGDKRLINSLKILENYGIAGVIPFV